MRESDIAYDGNDGSDGNRDERDPRADDHGNVAERE